MCIILSSSFGDDVELDNTFLNRFYRIVNKRGVPMEVITDNDGCFATANKELKEFVPDLHEEKINEA